MENPREIVEPGQDVRVKILEIDSERRRLSLSVKRVEDQILPRREVGEYETTDEGDETGEPAAAPQVDETDAVAAPEAPAEEPAPPAEEAPAAPQVDEPEAAANLDDVPELGLSEDVFADDDSARVQVPSDE